MLWQHIHESTIKNKHKIGEESIHSFYFSWSINNTLWQYFIRCNPQTTCYLETGLSFFFFKLTCGKWTLLLPWCAKHKIKNEKKRENSFFIFFMVNYCVSTCCTNSAMNVSKQQGSAVLSLIVHSQYFSTNRNRNFRISAHNSDKCESSRSSVWFGKLYQKAYIYIFFSICAVRIISVWELSEIKIWTWAIFSLDFIILFTGSFFLCILEDFSPTFWG